MEPDLRWERHEKRLEAKRKAKEQALIKQEEEEKQQKEEETAEKDESAEAEEPEGEKVRYPISSH